MPEEVKKLGGDFMTTTASSRRHRSLEPPAPQGLFLDLKQNDREFSAQSVAGDARSIILERESDRPREHHETTRVASSVE